LSRVFLSFVIFLILKSLIFMVAEEAKKAAEAAIDLQLATLVE
jgi:hypothetical protein